MREWLPSGLSGGGSSASANPNQVSVMGRMTGAFSERREQAGNAAAMAGLPGAPDDNAFKSCCPNLTFKERVYGCLGCFAIGFVISILGFMSFWSACMTPSVLSPAAAVPCAMTRAAHPRTPCVLRCLHLLAAGQIATFAVLYTLGNVISIIGSGCA